MDFNELGGPAEIAMNGTTIPAFLIQSISPSIEPGVRSRPSLAGTFSRPSGTFETVEVMATITLASMDWLKNIVPDMYNAPTAPQTTGNVIMGNNTCLAATGIPVNIHYTCDATDANDVFFPNAYVTFAFNGEYTETDPLAIEVRIYGNPSASGVVRFGTGDLTEVSIYDPTTETTVPVGS